MFTIMGTGTELTLRMHKWAVCFAEDAAHRLFFYDIDMLEDFTTQLSNHYEELEYTVEDVDTAHLLHLDGIKVDSLAQAAALIKQCEVDCE